MSRAAHCANLRSKKKMGPLKITSENFENIKLEDSMMTDGLMCALTGQHMGNTAENIAKKFQISRQAQDDFAFASVQKVRNEWPNSILPKKPGFEIVGSNNLNFNQSHFYNTLSKPEKTIMNRDCSNQTCFSGAFGEKGGKVQS